jgi:hypothetical protein
MGVRLSCERRVVFAPARDEKFSDATTEEPRLDYGRGADARESGKHRRPFGVHLNGVMGSSEKEPYDDPRAHLAAADPRDTAGEHEYRPGQIRGTVGIPPLFSRR